MLLDSISVFNDFSEIDHHVQVLRVMKWVFIGLIFINAFFDYVASLLFSSYTRLSLNFGY